jgi:FecR protein
MATCTATRGVALLRAALLVTTGLILSIGSPAWAGVGVTSGADGDPLGKPPNENERILRIGIDVQANELITTGATDRAHLVFLDGSSLTVGPDARLTIDRFVFDPNTKKGELAINASKGVLRMVGGKISKTNAITITTPSSTIGIRGGITIVSVTQVQTIADFVFGNSMTVTAGGKTETATRVGSQVITNAGGVPGAPTLLKAGSLSAALSNLEGAKSNSNNSADQSAEKSGFSNKNSGQPANAPNFNQNLPPNTNNNTLTSAVSFSNPAGQPVGNSTLQNQPTTNTVTITNTVAPINPINTPSTPTNTPFTPTNTPNNNPTPTPSGPTITTQTGFAPGFVLIDQPGGHGDHHSRHVRLLSLQGTVSITTDASNNQANGTIVVGVNGSHYPATATLPLSGTRNGTSVAMTNDPSRPPTVQIGGTTYPLDATSVLTSRTNSGCTCEFMSFGSWSSSVPDPRNNSNTLTARGTYVAGTPTTAVQLPQTGSANYNGVMLGNVNGSPSITSGSYQMGWNFADRLGNFSGNFDGRTYNGAMSAVPGSAGVNFAGPLSGGRRSGSVNGSFFGDGAKNQGGTFSIGSARSHYQATGVFAGQR